MNKQAAINELNLILESIRTHDEWDMDDPDNWFVMEVGIESIIEYIKDNK